MKRNARKAWNELEKKGVHVLDPLLGWGGHFAISAELYGDGSAGDDYDKKLDYYNDYFGTRTIIPEILSKNNLYFQWINAAVVGVFDA